MHSIYLIIYYINSYLSIYLCKSIKTALPLAEERKIIYALFKRIDERIDEWYNLIGAETAVLCDKYAQYYVTVYK